MIPPDAENPAARREARSGLVRVAIAGVIWGTIPLVIRAADGASAIKVFYRVLFAGLAILLWAAARGGLAELRTLSRRKLGQLAVQGAVLTVNWLLFLAALDLTNVATAELLAYTGPVFVAALAPLVTKERFDARILIPLALALGGIVVILAPQGLAVHGGRELLGAVLAFLSAITYASLLLRSKNILRGVSSTTLMIVEYAVASLLLSPVVIALYARGQGPTNARTYGALLVLGVVQTAFAGLLFIGALRLIRTDRAAILTYAEPVSAVLLAAIFLGEPLTVWTVLGGAMVVAGGILVARLEPPGAPEPVPIEAAGTESEDDVADADPCRDTPRTGTMG
jgi:drug/metabolite transporter (DMT)-like permease